ncbi:MAG: hypothetical protein QME12_08565 [Nanoarchaeota archaeon]|nr:hypothetical protein [Nanoarchaeota archaeon]
MATVTLTVSEQEKAEFKSFLWVNWSESAREDIEEDIAEEKILERLRAKLESKEEQELLKWSVELGRKAKKGGFKRLLAELSPKEREELLK